MSLLLSKQCGMKLDDLTKRNTVLREGEKQEKPLDTILEFLVFFVLCASLKTSLLVIKK